MARGNPVDEIASLKKQNGKDIILYGGTGFVSSQLTLGIIDDYNLIVNPVAFGNGMPIFKSPFRMQKFSLIE